MTVRNRLEAISRKLYPVDPKDNCCGSVSIQIQRRQMKYVSDKELEFKKLTDFEIEEKVSALEKALCE